MDGHIFITKQIGSSEGETGIRLFDIVSEVQSQPQATRFIVHISSPGGDAIEADMIAGYLDRMQEKIQVVAVGEGVVASAASKIFLTINQRAAGRDFQLMIHNPWGGVEGDAKYIKEYQAYVEKIEKDYEKFYATRLNIDEQTLSDLMDRETYIDAEQSKKLGIINYTLEEAPQVVFAIKSNINKKVEKMTPEDKTWLEEQLDSVKAFFKANPVKSVLIMSNEGVELNFPGEMPAVGDSVVAPDGTYTFLFAEKNWNAVIEANTLTSLEEVVTEEPVPENEEMEALKAENAALKEQLQNVEAMKKEVQSLSDYVAKHKAIQSKVNPEPNPAPKFEEPEVDPIKARLEEKRKQLKK